VILSFAMLSAASGSDDELVQLVINLLGEKDKELRALGFDQVRSEAKGAAATKRFAEQLSKLPAEAQVGLLSALADRGDSAARPAVLDLLKKSNDESVKVAAIGALGSLGEPADLPLLVGSLTSGSKAQQAAARASLVRMRGEAVPAAIVAEMKRAEPPARVALIEVLTTRRALDTIPDLLAAAMEADPIVRGAALTALGQLAGPEHISGMMQAVLKAERGRERDAAERAIMQVCARIADADKRADPLLAAMGKLGEADRSAMLPTLGRIGGPKARTAIESAIAATDPAEHEVGIRALCNWPDSSIAERLVELAEKDDHAAHRSMALAALIRVAPLPDKRPAAEKLALLKKAMSMCTRDEERLLVLKRASAIRTLDTLRFITAYLDQPAFAQQACESVVELAHHRSLREPNKAEFHAALDKVIQTSKDAVVVERANRYKRDQTWVRPKAQE
jgi:HEAT repeat protein